ncbi:Mannosyl-oligosaccharide glucosidase [Schistosoma japonicum]|uniref:Mannosyl-oligosaccharide glucosidase n=2 Tax=Schistosoma japonicum TaxID=6182 RepID=A0A4Z2CV10_SCHJA|nr:Mannosyl-oligosaccharide glucosidase [Schistosoma japonicum]
MPKSKTIEVRPRKRKQSQRIEEPTNSVPEHKREINHLSHLSDGSRHLKFKSRVSHERSFLTDFPIVSKVPKWLVLSVICGGILSFLMMFALRQTMVWYHGKQVVTPLNLPKVISDSSLSERSNRLFWGTYRPGIYFGMKHRSPISLLFGVMWTVQDAENFAFRHSCDQSDGVLSYNWLEHDGRNFGIQQIVDIHHTITISFVKPSDDSMGSDWAVRVSAVARNRTTMKYPLSVVVYFYYPGDESDIFIEPIISNKKVTGLQGSSMELSDFQIVFHPTPHKLQESSLVAHIPREDVIKETMFTGLKIRRDSNFLALTGVAENHNKDKPPNAWFYEISVNPNESNQPILEVEFRRPQNAYKGFYGDSFTRELSEQSRMFHEYFLERFHVDLTKFSDRQANLSKIAISNLLGGIGYFYGTSLVRNTNIGPEPVPNWSSGLFTATPSRPNFPRGFLWDEGFHGLILARWDPNLAMETVGSWLDLMNAHGWIPREQILGWEARSKVPSEFVIQSSDVANPPSLILTVEALLDRLPRLTVSEANEFRRWSMLVLPRLHVWYQWFNTTQIGSVRLSYRWRGRNPNEIHQLNPLTLSSGLDDFPRASHPTDDERHIDLRCWMTLFARVMAKLASVVTQFMQTEQNGTSRSKLEETRSLIAVYTRWADLLSDQGEMDKLHWSEKHGRYADYGLHTDFVKLEMPDIPTGERHVPNEQTKLIRVATEPPSLQLISTSFGYVNLFPLFLRVLSPTSPRLPRLLADLGNKELLWSEFGLRSINLGSPFYQTHNTKDDPPYWRGAIWININYLAVQSLRYYSHHSRTPAPVAAEAGRLAELLTQNLARTVLGELERTGFLWEQYNDQTGHGQRGHPFSGWTSLISLLISDSS